MKKCPYCAEEIQAEDVRCRSCGQDIFRASNAYAGSASAYRSSGRRRDIPRPPSGCLYWIIAFGTQIVFTLLALLSVTIVSSLDPSSSSDPILGDFTNASLGDLIVWLLLLVDYLGLSLLAAKGYAGAVRVSTFLLFLVWFAVPVLNLWPAYYMGKGAYMLLTKREFVDLIEDSAAQPASAPAAPPIEAEYLERVERDLRDKD